MQYSSSFEIVKCMTAIHVIYAKRYTFNSECVLFSLEGGRAIYPVWDQKQELMIVIQFIPVINCMHLYAICKLSLH